MDVRMANYNRPTCDTKIGAVLSKVIITILAIYIFYLIIINKTCLHLNFFNLKFPLRHQVEVYLVFVLLIMSVFAAVYFLVCRIEVSPRIFAAIIFILAILLKSLLVFLIDTKPVSDFNLFYQYALKLYNGYKPLDNILYFKTWAYQTGPVMYYAAIMKLFGTGLLPLKLVNCFFMAGTNVLIYLIARKISNDYAARAMAILYLLYPAPYFLTTVLTNQHFAACMILLAIYIFLSDKLNWAVKGIMAGAVIAIGNVVRPIGIVIVIASIVWGVVIVIRTRKYTKMASAILLLVAYLFVNQGCSYLVKYAGINSEGLVNNFPLWKFVVGLNYDSIGTFSYDDEDNVYKIQDFNERNNVAKQVIKQRLSIGIKQFTNLMNKKQIAMWANTDTLSWGFYQQVDGQLKPSEEIIKVEPTILKVEKIYYTLIFVILFLGLCKLVYNKKSTKINQEFLLLALILLCYFGAHFLIEIQVRYRYFAIIIVFIMASKGSEMFLFRRRKFDVKV